jgi:transketolase
VGTNSELDQLAIDTIRTLSMDAVQAANSGHPGTPMALAPVAYALYSRVMRCNPADPAWADRDRFVLSAGHASMLLYATLYMAGYEGVTLDDIKNFRQLGRPTAGHPEYGSVPGIEMTTGPLGQGISTAVGMALAERMLAARFNRDGHEIVDHRTWVIASDGDLMEGVSSEASSLAGHLGLGRLIVFWDDNHISIDGDTALAFTEDVAARYEAYGWHVQDLGENISVDELERAARTAMDEDTRPSLIIVRTHIAPGAPNKQDTAGAHGAPLGEDEIRLTKESYGWPADEQFRVPEEALAHFHTAMQRGASAQQAWAAAFELYRAEHPEPAAEFERIVTGELPEDWDADAPTFAADAGLIASRKASNQVIQWAAKAVPELVGGSADLTGSNLTEIKDGGAVRPADFAGRNIYYGVREFGMGCITNGLTLHGLRAFCGTFLIFSDYQKAAVRLAALMGVPSIFVYTHDSIGLGEDGPTHQPVEQLAGLRATPNLTVIRPADANETAQAWKYAITNTAGPTALALSRQGLPTLDPGLVPDDAVERGAYVLREAGNGDPKLILIATGSEVALALAAAEQLEQEEIATRVVSMPSMEVFAAQEYAYRDSVLPYTVSARIGIEASATIDMRQWIAHGKAIGMDTFGASAPDKALFEHFGITVDAVVAAGRRVTSY